VEAAEYDRIAAVEDEHWWYQNTRALMRELLAPWLGSDQRILDAGCGPGGNGSWLATHGQVVGVDLASESLAHVRARRPEIAPVQASVAALPFADASFDVVVAITVLTCVPDDDVALRDLARTVRPGGALLVMEPAYPSLRRAHDKTVHSLRRYRRPSLTRRLRAVGIEVRRATYAYSFLVPAAATLAVAEHIRPHRVDDAGSDVERRSLDRVFAWLSARERAWLSTRDLGIGTTLAVVGSRTA
jgi:ubiquinone/menaquinone biosynthesis C-methylase UbiE